ncbi:MAG: MBL fold metallo-hydrolase [Anaerolineales bacterium]|uniref:MBL fold metallo-hydrolase n=1 Tax=Candidatus Desulfolinea nitratireducens TaxID=2841698 RepID=A0A8J6TDD1_9CHLR|nr:MBL fold metallo-hydrolase [Candidatus Desulfolinea nitratireducens]
MKENLEVIFWGVRGSYPAPGKDTLRYGGNTSCIEIRAGEESIIFDAGTGIIALGREIAKRAAQHGKAMKVSLFLSHLHHDHIQGFPFFVPAFIPSADIRIFGPASSDEVLVQVLENNQSPHIFPVSLNEMAATKTIRAIREREQVVVMAEDAEIREAGSRVSEDAALIRVHHSYAHPGGVNIYKLEWHGKSIIYATDTEGYEGIDRRLGTFAHGADLLIHDAQYTQEHYLGNRPGASSTQGYGHSTIEMACEMAKEAGVGKLVLFHHDPGYNDESIAKNEVHAQRIFNNTFAAREGMHLLLRDDQKEGAWQFEKERADSIVERM